ncbi:MAG TPA: hypothetical protein VHH34_16940 [Pseudonocardiaceae bacterium]|nr:hypothetical protein [Pseudonocardiaceae bacterium]
MRTEAADPPGREPLGTGGQGCPQFLPRTDGRHDGAHISSAHPQPSIVIGLRRRSPPGKLLYGSTAQRILLDAECPGLAVEAPSER